MLTGQLQILVQGKNRECRVEYVHPDDPKQRQQRDALNPSDEAVRVHRRLLEIIEQAETGGGWKDVCAVEFDENDIGVRPRFFGFRPVGMVLEDATEQPIEPTKTVTLEVTPKPKRLADMRPAVQQPAVSPVSLSALTPRADSFRNPYNFIPTPPRRFPFDNPLGDHPPPGWDRLHPDLFTGWIDVELQAVTPLLTCDPETASLSNNDHRTFNRVLVDAQELPRLDPTSLRGMLSSAYEAITHSRWRVFHGHDARLARRMPVNDGLATAPFRVEQDDQGRLLARLLTGFTDRLPEYVGGNWRSPDNTMLAAFVPNYGPVDGKGVPPVGPDLHGSKVWARIGRVRRVAPGPTFFSWVVLDWKEDRNQLSTSNDDLRLPNRTAPQEIQVVRGWLCVTNRNIGSKKYERLFFHQSAIQYVLPLQDTADSGLNALGQSWGEVIDAYRVAHTPQEIWNRKDGVTKVTPDKYIDNQIGKTAWSGHIYRDGSKESRRLVAEDQDWAKLREGTLGYVYLDRQGRAISLVPVHIARYPFSHSPLDQLHPSLHPARHRSELSAADRVFGWVTQKGSGSHRGQLRITDVVCQTAREQAIQTFDPPLPLAILSTPKPKQTRFYLASDTSGTPHTGRNGDDDFSEGRSLRGIKVYPHQAGLPTGFWNVPADRQPTPALGRHYREYLKAGSPSQQRGNQNRSIKQWVNPQTRFTFRIHVTNLNAAELGGLLWMLSRNKENDDDQSPVCFRYGGAKPLGFGSCDLRIQRTNLYKGSKWSEVWGSLVAIPRSNATEQAQVIDEVIQAYQAALLAPFAAENPSIQHIEQLPMIAAWLRAAKASNDGTPTHYPRQQPKPRVEDKNYSWFDPRHGGEKPKLRSLLEDDRLTY